MLSASGEFIAAFAARTQAVVIQTVDCSCSAKLAKSPTGGPSRNSQRSTGRSGNHLQTAMRRTLATRLGRADWRTRAGNYVVLSILVDLLTQVRAREEGYQGADVADHSNSAHRTIEPGQADDSLTGAYRI